VPLTTEEEGVALAAGAVARRGARGASHAVERGGQLRERAYPPPRPAAFRC